MLRQFVGGLYIRDVLSNTQILPHFPDLPPKLNPLPRPHHMLVGGVRFAGPVATASAMHPTDAPASNGGIFA